MPRPPAKISIRPMSAGFPGLDGAADLFNNTNTRQGAMERQGVIEAGRKDI